MKQINGKVLVVTPEFILGLPEGAGNLAGKGLRCKTGGLGDVTPALVENIQNANPSLDLSVTMPYWESSVAEISNIASGDRKEFRRLLSKENVHMIDDSSFSQVNIKGKNTNMYETSFGFTEEQRAIAFNRGVINQLIFNGDYDAVWLQDWMSGLVGPAAKASGAKVLTTAHNFHTKEISWHDAYMSGINMNRFKDHVFRSDGPDGNIIDLLTTAVHSADYITTVSPTFLDEIVNGTAKIKIEPEHLVQEIRNKYHAGRARGILNPLQFERSPFKISYDSKPMDEVIAIRNENRAKLNQMAGLNNETHKPLLLWEHRLYEQQKSPEKFLDVVPQLVQEGFQVIINANGQEHYMQHARDLATQFPGNVVYHEFSEDVKTACENTDGIYPEYPSRYEPCGSQINDIAKGNSPIGHAVGGIADSVFNFDVRAKTGTGTRYEEHTSEALFKATLRARDIHNLPSEQRYELLKNASEFAHTNFGAKRAGQEYAEIITQLIYEKRYHNR